MFHEAYEIIHETLCDLHSGSPPERKECREADRFAAAVLMQPEVFAFLAEASRFDVIALQKAYGCSYALGDRADAGAAPAGGPVRAQGAGRSHRLGRVARARRAPGHGGQADAGLRCAGLTPPLRLAGAARPRRGTPISCSSMAEQIAPTGRAEYAETVSVAARPVFWNGRLAHVVVVAARHGDQAILAPQITCINRVVVGEENAKC